MRKWWARLSCLLLALLLLATTALPVFAAGEDSEEEGAQEDTTKDYVILLDCSLSTSLNDTKNLCLQACWNFLDKLPLYDTRLSIIAFGYEVKDDPGYTDFDSFTVNSERDMALVHELVPLSELTSSADRDEYKLRVQQALEEFRYESEKTFTPYTHALAAAVDMLEKNTDSEDARNACIILITDGVLDDREYFREEDKYGVSAEAERLLTEASQKAGTHDWPIYSIQLNYDNYDTYESELAAERLAKISANGGKNSIGSVACQDDKGVFSALMDIFADFNGIIPPPEHELLPLPGSVYFDVAALTSEASIDIFGEGISAVSLYQVDENNRRIKEYRTGISTDLEQGDLMVTASEGYYSIKMICPDEGRWEVYIEGTGGVEVLVSSSTLQEMRLSMTAVPVTQEDPLTKNNTIEVDALFTYHGNDEDNNDIYGAMPAMLKVFDINNRTIYTVDQNDTAHYTADKTGYHFSLPLNLFPDEQAIRLQVVVEDGMFRDGIKHSNIENFAFEDLDTILCAAGPKSLEAHVGDEFKLDMRDIYNNPDGDPLEYVLTCVNDASMVFEHTVENDQMVIQAGMKPGVYQMTIDVAGENVTYDQLTLTVVNDPPRMTADEIPDMELWSDHYSFQDIDSVINTVDLNDYFSDYENMPLSYSLQTSESGIVNIDENSGKLTLNTIEGAEGTVTVTVTAADGITPDSVATASFEVSVVSGKMVFWRENWIYFAIAGAILAIIVIAIIVVLKNKLVKGEWEIIVDDCGEAEQIPSLIDIAGFTSVGKKSKFKLVDLMNELSLFLPGGWGLKITNYFSVPGADKLMLVGVTRKKGCTVTNIPKDSRNVIVNTNGVNVAKSKVNFYSGTLTFVIEKDDGTGDRMTITMTLR